MHLCGILVPRTCLLATILFLLAKCESVPVGENNICSLFIVSKPLVDFLSPSGLPVQWLIIDFTAILLAQSMYKHASSTFYAPPSLYERCKFMERFSMHLLIAEYWQ